MTITETGTTVPLLNLEGIDEVHAEAESISKAITALQEPVWAVINRAKVLFQRGQELERLATERLVEQSGVDEIDLDDNIVDGISATVSLLCGLDDLYRLLTILSNITHPENVLDVPGRRADVDTEVVE